MTIILVHGIWDCGASMEGLARRLSSEGHRCLTPSLVPSDGSQGIPELAGQLLELIEESLSGAERFVIVGFSLGAIVVRYYLQMLGGHRRARAYVSICGPHAGTVTAWLGWSRVARQLRPESDLLTELDRTGEVLGSLPKICYWNRFDLMILPGRSARWSGAEAVETPAIWHKGTLSSRVLFRDLAERMVRW
ncbi:alpha/beta fold hydrolase [Verrucomicrobiaceae bacterium 227]